VAVVDINVTYDVQALKTQLNQLFPSERVEVRASSNALVLGGTVSGENTMSRVLAVANQYAPGRVANMLNVRGSQQVMLQVRFAEVQRSVTRELGVKTRVSNDNFVFGSTGLLNRSGSAAASMLLTGSVFGTEVRFVIDALEAKGVLKVLAEPNLIALSGDTASFLAGGEFPIDTVQAAATEALGGAATFTDAIVTTSFKEFGVGLSFTPTVVDGDLINLVVETEVSAIDFTLSEQLNSDNPSVSTRRANTTVELRDGQSFSIAGLLQNSFRDNVSHLPWLGDVPILGSLFRSSDFARNETELVVIVTAYLVQPANAGQLTTPVDNFIEPSDFDLFFWGRTEGTPVTPTAGGAAAAGPMLSAQPDGGVAGAYGHIIE
jgi:pilus assembly protein CpaC